MTQKSISDVQSGYDHIADEYARRIYDELRNKPLDRELLNRFAESVGADGMACDLGCGPGHVARYLQGRGIQVCGLDLSEGMLERARQLNPGVQFYQGDMRALTVAGNTWAGIAAFYAIVNLSLADVSCSLQEMMRVNLSASSGSHSTVNSVPGRFFFICTGKPKTSSAPSSSKRSNT